MLSCCTCRCTNGNIETIQGFNFMTGWQLEHFPECLILTTVCIFWSIRILQEVLMEEQSYRTLYNIPLSINTNFIFVTINCRGPRWWVLVQGVIFPGLMISHLDKRDSYRVYRKSKARHLILVQINRVMKETALIS